MSNSLISSRPTLYAGPALDYYNVPAYATPVSYPSLGVCDKPYYGRKNYLKKAPRWG